MTDKLDISPEQRAFLQTSDLASAQLCYLKRVLESESTTVEIHPSWIEQLEIEFHRSPNHSKGSMLSRILPDMSARGRKKSGKKHGRDGSIIRDANRPLAALQDLKDYLQSIFLKLDEIVSKSTVLDTVSDFKDEDSGFESDCDDDDDVDVESLIDLGIPQDMVLTRSYEDSVSSRSVFGPELPPRPLSSRKWVFGKRERFLICHLIVLASELEAQVPHLPDVIDGSLVGLASSANRMVAMIYYICLITTTCMRTSHIRFLHTVFPILTEWCHYVAEKRCHRSFRKSCRLFQKMFDALQLPTLDPNETFSHFHVEEWGAVIQGDFLIQNWDGSWRRQYCNGHYGQGLILRHTFIGHSKLLDGLTFVIIAWHQNAALWWNSYAWTMIPDILQEWNTIIIQVGADYNGDDGFKDLEDKFIKYLVELGLPKDRFFGFFDIDPAGIKLVNALESKTGVEINVLRPKAKYLIDQAPVKLFEAATAQQMETFQNHANTFVQKHPSQSRSRREIVEQVQKGGFHYINNYCPLSMLAESFHRKFGQKEDWPALRESLDRSRRNL
jgi:hypothetical protein